MLFKISWIGNYKGHWWWQVEPVCVWWC